MVFADIQVGVILSQTDRLPLQGLPRNSRQQSIGDVTCNQHKHNVFLFEQSQTMIELDHP